MRRVVTVVASVVMLGSGCRAEAGCRLRVVSYNIAKLNSENHVPQDQEEQPEPMGVLAALRHP